MEPMAPHDTHASLPTPPESSHDAGSTMAMHQSSQLALSEMSTIETLSSQPVASESARSSIDVRGPTRPNTPTSCLSRNSNSVAARTVSANKSNSSGSPSDEELGRASLTPKTEAVIHSLEVVVSNGQGTTVHYKTMSWVHAGIVMIAETISLGILSLPRAMSTLGLVPGFVLIFSLGLIATYTGYVVYQFKMRYPNTSSFADAGALAFGKPGRWIGEVLQNLLLIFIMSAHVLTFTIMMNTLTEHGLCTIVFGLIGAVISFIAAMPRTLKANSYISIFSCLSIATATIIAMVGISISRPGMGNSFAILPDRLGTFTDSAMSVSNIVLAYNGHIAYPTIISEMKEPRDFPKALVLLESVTITFYIVAAVVIYYYAGQNVASPAIGSAGPLVKKIAFGIAIPTIIVAGVIPAIVAAKTIYNHLWAKKPDVVNEKTFRARGSWWAIIGLLWAAAWVIASAVPVFNQLVALIGALFGTWFVLGFCAMMWLWMNWQGSLRSSYGISWAKLALAVLNMVIFAMSASLCVLGTYASLKEIATNGASRAPFSCADNALPGGA